MDDQKPYTGRFHGFGACQAQLLQGRLSEFKVGTLFYCVHCKVRDDLYDPRLRNFGTRSLLNFTNEVTSPPRFRIDRPPSFDGRSSKEFTIIAWNFYIIELRFGHSCSEKNNQYLILIWVLTWFLATVCDLGIVPTVIDDTEGVRHALSSTFRKHSLRLGSCMGLFITITFSSILDKWLAFPA